MKGVYWFWKKFAQFLGVKYIVGVASGTDAITLALIASSICEGDEVITTNLTASNNYRNSP